MKDDRIQKLPRWVQTYISDLEQSLAQSEEHVEALQLMLEGFPEVEPDIEPPNTFKEILNGWLASRPMRTYESQPCLSKACTSSVSHSGSEWDNTTTQRPIRLFSSPGRALRSLLPQILNAYTKEIAATIKMIKEVES